MTLKGKIKNGRVVLDVPVKLADGTQVEVRPVKKKEVKKTVKVKKKPQPKTKPLSLADRLRPFIGAAKNLPPDMSVNLDHYLYGLPKRKP